MFKLAEYLPPFPNATWTLARQAGVTHAVSQVPPDDVDGPGWEFLPLLRMKTRFADAGLTLEVIETGFPWLHAAKLGLPGADEEIERCCTLIRNLGAVGVPVVCWNWMAGFNWMRTSTTTFSRGGALVTSYDHALMRDAPHTPTGEVSDDTLWETLRRFMERVVPVAAEAGVKLALHPDDPPISPIRGMARILRTPEAMRRAIELAPSPHNGITMCQGTFATMGADIPAEIRDFADRGALHFVHFRDVRGTSSTSAMCAVLRSASSRRSMTRDRRICSRRCGRIRRSASTALCGRIMCRRWKERRISPPATTCWGASSPLATSRGWPRVQLRRESGVGKYERRQDGKTARRPVGSEIGQGGARLMADSQEPLADSR
ncbi:MAG: mannonate dehydratase [Thermomicrobiales bacterium]|nr:mannonate dehydratase [Thermomicrobiales bacterium]